MRILFISHKCDRSGAVMALLQELHFLKKNHKDIDAHILMLKGGELLEDFRKLYPVIYNNTRNSIPNRIMRRFRKEKYKYPYLSLCKKNKYDCIYANTVATFDAAIHLKKKLGIPLIGHVHEAESLILEFNINGNEFKEFNQIITVSELAKNNLINTYSYPIEKIYIQHPFSIWLEKYLKDDVTINPIKFKSDVFTIGLFCYGGWQKSLETLPFVIHAFYRKYPDAKCQIVVVGNIGNNMLYHTKYDLKKMNLGDKVQWIGAVKNPLDYQAGFDIFLLLSREESFSLSAEEASITETPIIGFEGATGAAEWIKDGAGLLVPYMDFEALADALYQLYTDTKLRRSLGKTGKKIVTKLYENDSKMENIYNAIMNVKQ